MARPQSRSDNLRMIAQLAVAATVLLGGAGPVEVALTAPGHTPRINTHWNYVVRATRDGRPVAGRLTEQIVDPIGGTHPVEFGKSTKTITNRPFTGVFKDFIIWPASSRGIPLRLRVIVRIGTIRTVVDYRVTPRG